MVDGDDNDVSSFGTISYVYYDGNRNQLVSPPVNAGTYGVKAVFTSNDAGYTDAESGIVSFRISAVSLDEFASASTQAALNIAKMGTVSFAIELSGGIVDGQTVADLFNGATFELKTEGYDAEQPPITAVATVIDNIVYVSLQMDQQLFNFLKTGWDDVETSAAKANWETITLCANSNDNNYTISADALTRIFLSGKTVFA